MTRLKTYENFNTTGSCWQAIEDGTIYSYSTPIFKVFNTKVGTIAVINNTFYSMTTRRHQSIRDCYRPLEDYPNIDRVLYLHHQGYGLGYIGDVLDNELRGLNFELSILNDKKRLGKNQKQSKENLEKTITELRQLRMEV